jgi:CDP-glucose 4,6-dehydratase
MENLGIIKPEFWKAKKVLITGHTGFKGTWLSLWLKNLGAEVSGFSNGITTNPSFYELLDWGGNFHSFTGDIRNLDELAKFMAASGPEIVFHLAAQSLVVQSYKDPVGTVATNVMGTLHVLEAVRNIPSVKAVVVVTSDKCYENHENKAYYTENDSLGGRDPYSSSKACAELLTAAYRTSFFQSGNAGGAMKIGLASARAGNVIGGGDWAADRLIPDCVRAFSKNETAIIRNPNSIRPWQHVLDALRGYMLLAQDLFVDNKRCSQSFNFGPNAGDSYSVSSVVSELVRLWGGPVQWKIEKTEQFKNIKEADYLHLDSSRAVKELNWRPLLNFKQSLEMTAAWYRSYLKGEPIIKESLAQINLMKTFEMQNERQL